MEISALWHAEDVKYTLGDSEGGVQVFSTAESYFSKLVSQKFLMKTISAPITAIITV